jgi:glycosyltransferase involved in cell wall biosynthesis
VGQNSLKVIFVTDGIFPYAVGGMQRHSRLLIEALATTKTCELIVVHPHTNFRIFETFPCITEIALPMVKPSNQWQYLLHHYRYSSHVLKILKQHPTAIIYSQGMAVWKGIKQVQHRLIINPHGLEFFQVLTLKEKIITLLFRWIHKYLFRHCARVISLGGRLTDLLIKQGRVEKERIVIIPNAVNMPEPFTRHYDKSVLQFLFVGRFAFNKGIDILARAIQHINQEGYAGRMQFVLVGQGPEYDRITATLKEPNVLFTGGIDDEMLSRLYRESDVFVLPTLFEGMPTVALEAMSYGLPLIITDTGATLELADEDNALIIEKRSVSSLVEALRTMVRMDSASRKKMSEASLQKVSRKFTWQVVAAQHVNLFQTLVRQQ